MSLITKGLDILSARLGLKRSRPASEEAPPPHIRPSASQCTEEQAMQELGRCSLHTGGSGSMESALKRSRLVKTDPEAGSSAIPGASGQASLPFATAFDNPLFDSDNSEDEDEFPLMAGGSQVAGEENAGWLGNITLPGGSASPPLRRLQPPGGCGAQGRSLWHSSPSPLLGSSGIKPFAGIPSSSEVGGTRILADLLPAFKREVQSPLVLSALCSLERQRLHPLGADDEDFFDSIEGTCAGLLVLCRRARIGCEELSAELLLTLLWLMESCESQYRNELSICLKSYLRFHPGAYYMREGLRRRMVALQAQVLGCCGWRVLLLDCSPVLASTALQVLERCGWRVLLRDREELRAAMKELESDRSSNYPRFCPPPHSFTRLCDHIADCAEDGVLPLGSLPLAGSPHSPHAAAAVSGAVAAAQGCSLSGEVGIDGEPSPLICASEAAAAGLGGGHWEGNAGAAGTAAGDGTALGKFAAVPHIVTQAAVEGLRARSALVAR
ncbi:hypothetical protein COHA_008235 [Chlorella ohadii]|uniref:Uncharacterized protein n=1 Tax=Chlorella ohadii TaxID=2649997 RepID=A0AAD5DP66_9CHLO|nr:hypothetical protein COHA_008235 [Chlorella ohadii]